MNRVLMLVSLIPWICSVSYGSEEQPQKLHVNVKKGRKVEFVVKMISSMEGKSSRGDFKAGGETEVVYRIEFGEKTEGGLNLKVNCNSIKAKMEGREETWEFDSSKKEGDGVAAEYLRKVLASTATVQVQGGKIGEISGLPERPEIEQGQWQLRQRMFVNQRAMQRDLELILSSPVQDQTLEEGKEYRPEAPAADSGERRRRFRRSIAYTLKGLQKRTATFTLKSFRPEGQSDEGPFGNMEVKSNGTARVNLRDGLILRLNFESESSSKGERDGQSFAFSSKSKVEVQRKRPQGANQKKARPKKARKKKQG